MSWNKNSPWIEEDDKWYHDSNEILIIGGIMIVWKYAKLMEVIVSPDPVNSHADGYIQMVHLG